MGRRHGPPVVGGHHRAAGALLRPGIGQRQLVGHRRAAWWRGPGRGRGAGRGQPRGAGRARPQHRHDGPARSGRAGPAREPRERHQDRQDGQGLGRHDGLRQAATRRGAIPGRRRHGDLRGRAPDDLQRARLRRTGGALLPGRYRPFRRRRVRHGSRDGRPHWPPPFPRLRRGAGLAGRHDRRRRGHAMGRAGAGRGRPPLPPRRHARRHGRAACDQPHLGRVRRHRGARSVHHDLVVRLRT